MVFAFEGCTPEQTGAIVDHIHGVFVAPAVGAKRSREIDVPLGASYHGFSRGSLDGSRSEKRGSCAFFTEFVTFVTHRYVAELATSDQTISDSPGGMTHPSMNQVPHVCGVSCVLCRFRTAPVFHGGRFTITGGRAREFVLYRLLRGLIRFSKLALEGIQ